MCCCCRDILSRVSSPVVFSHNDLQAGESLLKNSRINYFTCGICIIVFIANQPDVLHTHDAVVHRFLSRQHLIFSE
jgi:hypothetical protein